MEEALLLNIYIGGRLRAVTYTTGPPFEMVQHLLMSNVMLSDEEKGMWLGLQYDNPPQTVRRAGEEAIGEPDSDEEPMPGSAKGKVYILEEKDLEDLE